MRDKVITTILFCMIVVTVIYCNNVNKEDMILNGYDFKQPIYYTFWYIDRGWRENWKCKTKEEARERAGDGRIYPETKIIGYKIIHIKGKYEN